MSSQRIVNGHLAVDKVGVDHDPGEQIIEVVCDPRRAARDFRASASRYLALEFHSFRQVTDVELNRSAVPLVVDVSDISV